MMGALYPAEALDWHSDLHSIRTLFDDDLPILQTRKKPCSACAIKFSHLEYFCKSHHKLAAAAS